MKKFLTIAVLLVFVVSANAQDVIDHFIVGPYEVDYRGDGDVVYRLRGDIDLYEYFDLERNTIPVDSTIVLAEPVCSKDDYIQTDISFAMPRYSKGVANVFGVDIMWKKRVTNKTTFNAGLRAAMSFGKYDQYDLAQMDKDSNHKESVNATTHICDTVNHSVKELTENFIEIGVPLGFEFCLQPYKQASLFASIGVTPTFYCTTKQDAFMKNSNESIPVDGNMENAAENVTGTPNIADCRQVKSAASAAQPSQDTSNPSGIYIAPRLEIGGYVPAGNQLVRIAGFIQYNINCSNKDNDQFKKHIERAFVGMSLGLLF